MFFFHFQILLVSHSLSTVIMPGVTSVGVGAFYGDESLVCVEASEAAVAQIPELPLNKCPLIPTAEPSLSPSSLPWITCTNLVTCNALIPAGVQFGVIIPYGTQSIDSYAFYGLEFT